MEVLRQLTAVLGFVAARVCGDASAGAMAARRALGAALWPTLAARTCELLLAPHLPAPNSPEHRAVSDACLALEAEVARLGFVAPFDDDNEDDAGEDQGGDARGPGAAPAKLGPVAPADPLSSYIAESVMLTANRQRQQLLERARAVWLETEGSGNTVAVAHATEQRANLFGDFVAAGALEEE